MTGKHFSLEAPGRLPKALVQHVDSLSLKNEEAYGIQLSLASVLGYIA